MNELINSEEILAKASDCFKGVRRNILEGSALLHQIYTQDLFKPHYSSFSAYVEQECQIGVSFASKLIKVYEQYVVTGGISVNQIADIENERLYLALQLPGTLADKVEKARLLTRSELKQERAEKDGHDCLHDCEHIKICTKCHARV